MLRKVYLCLYLARATCQTRRVRLAFLKLAAALPLPYLHNDDGQHEAFIRPRRLPLLIRTYNSCSVKYWQLGARCT